MTDKEMVDHVRAACAAVNRAAEEARTAGLVVDLAVIDYYERDGNYVVVKSARREL